MRDAETMPVRSGGLEAGPFRVAIMLAEVGRGSFRVHGQRSGLRGIAGRTMANHYLVSLCQRGVALRFSRQPLSLTPISLRTAVLVVPLGQPGALVVFIVIQIRIQVRRVPLA